MEILVIYGFARKEIIHKEAVGDRFGGGAPAREYEVEKDLLYLGFYATKEMAQKRLDEMRHNKPFIKEYVVNEN